MEITWEHRLTETEERCKSNQHRIEKLETSAEALNRLATNMEVMVEKQGQVADTVEKLDGKVTALESKPAKKWDAMVDKIAWAVVGAVIVFLLGQIGL
jgi:hypothetical protein